MQSQREAHMFHLVREVEKVCNVLDEKKVISSLLVNSDIKSEKIDLLLLFYHLTIPLKALHSECTRNNCC